MENRITAFVRKKVVLFNNIRIPKTMYSDIVSDIKISLIKFLISEFNDYKSSFIYNDDELIKFPKDQKFGDEYKKFYTIFIKILDDNKQSIDEIQKYGSHSFIINAAKDFLYDIYAYFI